MMNVVDIASERRSLDMVDRFTLPEGMTVTATDGPCGFEIGGVDLADDLSGGHCQVNVLAIIKHTEGCTKTLDFCDDLRPVSRHIQLRVC